MDNGGRNRLWLGVGGVTLLVLIIFLVIHFLFPKHDWNEKYERDFKEPYGGYLCEQLLKNYFPGKEYTQLKTRWDSASVITDTNRHNTNYVFLGTDCYMDTGSARQLARYVARGNTAMLITPTVPYDILHQLGITTCSNGSSTPVTASYSDEDSQNEDDSDTTTIAIDSVAKSNMDTILAANEVDTTAKIDTAVVDTNEVDYGYDNYVDYSKETYIQTPSVTLNFTHPKLQTIQGYTYHFIVDKDTPMHYWHYLVPDQECLSYKFKYAELGVLGNDHLNFIRVKYGKGSFLLHTTPVAFSNYYLLDKEHLDYAEKAFSHLTEGNIYWDEYSQHDHPDKETHHKKYKGSDEQSPLRFILSQDSLRWAWYLILSLIVLYSVFQLKRRQRMIPVLEPNVNTSMEFAQTVARLYFQQNDHRSLAVQQMRLFLAFIRSRYHINTSMPEKELQARIVAKSGISEDNVALLFARFITIQEMPDINEKILIEFHQSLENFYQQCK